MTGSKFAVTVALFGNAEWTGDGVAPAERLKTYSQRQKVNLSVEPDDDFGSVMRPAAAEFGVPPRGGWHGFYRAEDESSHDDWHWYSALPLIDEAGRVRWRFVHDGLAYAEVLRSGEAGALDGDPLRPYLVLLPSIGDGLLPDWGSFVHVLELLFAAMGAVSAGEGTMQAKDRITRMLRHGRGAKQAIERASPGWENRGGDPWLFSQWLDERPWLPADLAPLLDCTSTEAEAILWAFGFAETDSGLWRRRVTSEAEWMWANERLMINTAIHMTPDEAMSKTFRDRVSRYAETGESGDLDIRRIDWLSGRQAEAASDSISQGRRGSWISRLFGRR